MISKWFSDLRQIPDNQEVFGHSSTDQSIVIEIMEYTQAEDDIQAIRYICITIYDFFLILYQLKLLSVGNFTPIVCSTQMKSVSI